MAVTEPQAIAAGPARDIRRELILLLMVVASLSVTSGIFETTLNNFLKDTFDLTAAQRGRRACDWGQWRGSALSRGGAQRARWCLEVSDAG